MFEKIVKELPKEYISNSLLKYEYNSDGTKKTLVELMDDKDQYKKNGQNLDSLYDFIIDCDYNLQVQEIALKIEKLDILNISFEKKVLLKEEYIKKLKKAYHIQEFSYKQIHSLFQKRMNIINKKLRELSIRRPIDFIESSDRTKELLIELSYYRNIEIQILAHIKDYRYQKQEYLKQEEIYSQNMKIINDYKNKKGILDVIKNGMIFDETDYNKLIATVIKELNDPNIDVNKKKNLLKVKNAIQMIYFKKTIEKTNKQK